MEPDPIATLLRVSRVLDNLAIQYCVGGSLASSLYGIPRATNDIDLVVDLRSEHVELLVAAFGAAFMIDPQAVMAAIASGRSFNLIEYATLDKVDIFVAAEQSWAHQQLRRRRAVMLSDEAGSASVSFVSPEDIVLNKLLWYRRGGEVSDRQWQDLLTVLVVQANEIDWTYLRQWADTLGIQDLLTRAAEAVRSGGAPN